jgi:hypothetical protein
MLDVNQIRRRCGTSTVNGRLNRSLGAAESFRPIGAIGTIGTGGGKLGQTSDFGPGAYRVLIRPRDTSNSGATKWS